MVGLEGEIAVVGLEGEIVGVDLEGEIVGVDLEQVIVVIGAAVKLGVLDLGGQCQRVLRFLLLMKSTFVDEHL